jgi:hypothetical protein
MRDHFTSPRKFGLGGAFGVLFGLMAFGQAAQAANPLELNFGLFGPRYDGRVAECEAALGTITSQFQEKESKFWNSDLQITAYGQIRETAFRPWQSDNIPRRYCSADVMLSDGKPRVVHYSIIEDGGFRPGRRMVRDRARPQLGLQSGLRRRQTLIFRRFFSIV